MASAKMPSSIKRAITRTAASTTPYVKAANAEKILEKIRAVSVEPTRQKVDKETRKAEPEIQDEAAMQTSVDAQAGESDDPEDEEEAGSDAEGLEKNEIDVEPPSGIDVLLPSIADAATAETNVDGTNADRLDGGVLKIIPPTKGSADRSDKHKKAQFKSLLLKVSAHCILAQCQRVSM
eukprot:scaffold134816_cov51-Prasinocladus_malaysianus.AAC.1